MAAGRSSRLFNYLILGFWGLVTLAPLIAMVVVSFWQNPHEAFLNHAKPQWSFTAYTQLFLQIPVMVYGLNSLIVASATTLGYTLFAAMAGYALAQLQIAGKSLWLGLILMTLMIPPQVNLVPLFLLMAKLGWLNSLWALILPGLFGAYGVFMMRQWFLSFPVALKESAALDGCSHWRTFWLIALPTARPALTSLALYVFIATWNSFIWPLVATHTEGIRTLPIGLAALKASFRDGIDWPLMLAAATCTLLPVLLITLFGQRAWLQATLGGSLKE